MLIYSQNTKMRSKIFKKYFFIPKFRFQKKYFSKISEKSKKIFDFFENFQTQGIEKSKIFFLKSKFRDEKIIFENFRSHFRVLCLNQHIEKVCCNFLSIISEFPATSKKKPKVLNLKLRILTSFAASSLLKCYSLMFRQHTLTKWSSFFIFLRI